MEYADEYSKESRCSLNIIFVCCMYMKIIGNTVYGTYSDVHIVLGGEIINSSHCRYQTQS